ncbi:ectoine hydroxylase-related dioxygenase (phytanoyl-CoA dioxygenase family) [Dyadobacter jejuensis]|uniref:Ectoine hydroxylase-related dioxygenase (Phytanoyl-CoA dioxygenase family) n=1 Tax=Dyadobacter jejuensis TaxID=1082580 RepID=A0A316ACZ6_9BACT|nr:phytanoyl-CoA dioxygenase family protein [Dyadobacter jejuensis]PWJ55279.1 ectoine hydroxylase-related dioxygenase (phytanoyl-CoA dioxygenase family) [Dyadobacter jejuensis]
MNSIRKQFNEEGYVLLRNFLDKEIISEIYTDARKIFAQQIKKVTGRTVDIDDRDAFEAAMFEFFEKDFVSFVNTGKTVQHTFSLHRLGVDPLIANLLKEVGLSNPIIGARPAMQFNSRYLSKDGSKHWKLDPHQDWRTGQGSLDSAVIWFPMVDAGADIGALQIIPGSHKAGLKESSTSGYQGGITADLKEDAFVQTTFETGDLLIFSAFLIHQSGNNITKNIRWSVQLRYNNLDEPTFIDRGYPMAYIYKPETELVTPNFPTAEQLETVFK